MKKNIFNAFAFSLAFSLIPLVGSAQNLNPVVEISKSYVGKLSETRKPIETMAVPDSLMRFDLDFDYSVFDNPYRGAYIFSPYVVDIRPQKVLPWNKKFYLKAGAGYMLRPEVDMFWSPKMSDRFKLNIYATENSFLGPYKNVSSFAEDPSTASKYEMEKTHKGYDVEVRTGANGYWDWKTGRLLFDVAYSGLHNGDSLIRSSYNALDLSLRMQSNKRQRPYFFYDAGVEMRLGNDRIHPEAAEKGLLPALPVSPAEPGMTASDADPFQHFSPMIPAVWVDDYTTHFMDLIFDGTLGPKFNSESSFMMDFHLGYHRIGLMDPSAMGSFNATPRYVLDHNRWKLSAGVKLATVYKSNTSVSEAVPNEFGSYLGSMNLLGNSKSQHVYPYLFVSFDAIKEHLNIYLKVDGGDQVNDYTRLKQRNHFFNLTSASGLRPVIGNSINKFDVSLGFRGNIAKAFDFNVYGGFRSMRNGLVDAVFEVDGENIACTPFLSTVNYVNYDHAYVNADFSLNYRNILVDGELQFNHTDLYKKEAVGFEPARFMTDLKVRYNWKNRLHVGIDASGASARRGFVQDMRNSLTVDGQTIVRKYAGKLPAYVDLGLSAEFFLNRKMSVWLRGDNLLNMSIQRVPLYPEGGIGFTAGICLNL